MLMGNINSSAVITAFGRSNRVSVALSDGNLNELSDAQYQSTFSADLSNIFMPFSSTQGSEVLPSFHANSPTDAGSGIGFFNLLPFEWTPFVDTVKDIQSNDNSDGLIGIISDTTQVGDIDHYRDHSNMRSFGLRLPIFGVGWGYTTQNLPIPRDESNETKFKGGVAGLDNGYQVDPKDYVAAPVDLRYDEDRHVWTTSTKEVYAKITSNNGTAHSW